jgi:Dyp-type peroxidase family
MATYRILALDGGGIRGIVTAKLLKRLADHKDLPNVFDSVDLIAGNSSGALIALAMAHGLKTPGSMQSTIAQICDVFHDGRKIFGPTYLPIWLGGWLFWSKYGNERRADGLQKVLIVPDGADGMRPAKLGDLRRKVLVTAFDLDNEGKTEEGIAAARRWKPKLFHNFVTVNGQGVDRERQPDSDLETEAWRVALYSTAAPTYFPSVDGFVDGGIYANNPAMCALAQVLDKRYELTPKRPRVDPDEIVLLSLGAGRHQRVIPTKRFPVAGFNKWWNEIRWGALRWAWHFPDATIEGTAAVADYQLAQILEEHRYHRLDIDFDEGERIDIDDFDRIPDLEQCVDTLADEKLRPTVEWLKRHWVDKPERRSAVHVEATSKHLLGTTELTCLMPIKTGFIGEFETRTYATRLRLLMRVLHSLRVASRERASARVFPDIVDAISAIHSFRLSIVSNKHLLLAVTFDRPWEPYLRLVWEGLGPLLDPLLINCVDYDDHASDKGFDRFSSWVRRHQIEANLFYTASPLTVDDTRYLEQLERAQRSERDPKRFARAAATFAADGAIAEAERAAKNNPSLVLEQGLKVIAAFYSLRESYPDRAPDGTPLRDGGYLRRAATTTLALLKDFDLGKLPPSIEQQFQAELEWFRGSTSGSHKPPRRPPPNPKEIQAGILNPPRDTVDKTHYRATHGCLLLARVVYPDRARAFLRSELIPLVAAEGARPNKGVYTNVAFTFRGLQCIGVSPTDLMHFPKEFKEGMEARAGLLGDVRSNHPSQWSHPPHNWGPRREKELPPARISTVDIVVQMRYAGTSEESVHRWDAMHPLYGPALTLFQEPEKTGIEVMSVQPMLHHMRNGQVIDHFGFADGLSQPVPDPHLPPADERANDPWTNRVPLGELLLGYENDLGDPGFPPQGDPTALPGRHQGALLDNGTFLVVRKLQQHTDAWRKFIADGASAGVGEQLLRGKVMGRDSRGDPITKPASGNDFDYAGDSGARCPLHAHIRRGNPRSGRVPRIMRRGMSYGPRDDDRTDGEERGLMFLAYNASIAEQFEVLQRWMTGGNSTGGFSGHVDPFLRVPQADELREFRFVDGQDVRCVPLGETPLVSLKWGLYLFVPSIKALNDVAAEPSVDEAARLAEIELGERVIASLQTDNDWSAILEDVSASHSGTTAAVCAAIRARGGVLRTPDRGMVLIASHDLVMKVLKDDKTFSVSEYHARMKQSVGEGYLGLDDSPIYRQQSTEPNKVVAKISSEEAFDIARKETKQVLVAFAAKFAPAPVTVAADVLADQVLARLSAYWFGIPKGEIQVGGRPVGGSKKVHLPFNSLAPSRYVFSSPRLRGPVIRAGQHYGKNLLEAVTKHAKDGGRQAFRGASIGEALWDLATPTGTTDHDLFARALVGMIEGFLPTVYGNFVKTMHLWLGNETLWRVQHNLLLTEGSIAYPQAKAALEPELMRAMQTRPVPDLVYRTAQARSELGGATITRGERVVVLIASATQELAAKGQVDDVYPVFGGDRRVEPHPTHACPAYAMGMGVLLGMISAVVEAGTLAPTDNPLGMVLTPAVSPVGRAGASAVRGGGGGGGGGAPTDVVGV